MKVTQSTELANLSNAISPSRQARPQSPAEAAPQTELSLTPASQSVFAGKPERIAELRQMVNSGSYAPDTTAVSEKMIEGAISRPE